MQKYLPKFSFAVNGVLLNQLQKLNTEISLLQCEFEVLPGSVDFDKRNPITKPIRVEAIKKSKQRGIDILEITLRVKDENRAGWVPGNLFGFSFDNILGDVLDYNDLMEWSTIKDISLGEYYYQQLEMFNFALPADDTESKA